MHATPVASFPKRVSICLYDKNLENDVVVGIYQDAVSLDI